MSVRTNLTADAPINCGLSANLDICWTTWSRQTSFCVSILVTRSTPRTSVSRERMKSLAHRHNACVNLADALLLLFGPKIEEKKSDCTQQHRSQTSGDQHTGVQLTCLSPKLVAAINAIAVFVFMLIMLIKFNLSSFIKKPIGSTETKATAA